MIKKKQYKCKKTLCYYNLEKICVCPDIENEPSQECIHFIAITKESRLNIRISDKLKQDFDAWCRDNGTTPSDEIRRYITKLIKTKDK